MPSSLSSKPSVNSSSVRTDIEVVEILYRIFDTRTKMWYGRANRRHGTWVIREQFGKLMSEKVANDIVKSFQEVVLVKYILRRAREE